MKVTGTVLALAAASAIGFAGGASASPIIAGVPSGSGHGLLGTLLANKLPSLNLNVPLSLPLLGTVTVKTGIGGAQYLHPTQATVNLSLPGLGEVP